MRLSHLLGASVSYDPEICGIQYDSRKVGPGEVFFAVPGFKEDGTKYLGQAFAAGAAAAVVEGRARIPADYSSKCVPTENVREALADASARFFGEPAKKLRMFGITGTKGKTSTTYLVESILSAGAGQTALLGTVECRHPGGSKPSERTTMESLDLQRFLSEAVMHGAKQVAMEVSSHALSLHRVRNCVFDGALFTNLSPDHLDFYGDMESYFQAKTLLFQPPYLKPEGVAVANCEDPYGERLIREVSAPWLTYGLRKGDVRAESFTVDARGIRCVVDAGKFGRFSIQSSLVGEFNLRNILAATALALGAGIPSANIVAGISSLSSFPGRLERIPTRLPFSVFVDFAHMGHALENVLRTLRPMCRGRLIVVFGAGGDKDPARRTQLGTVAAQLADFAFITSDNPRSEDPNKIIAAIDSAFLGAGGVEKRRIIQPDRRKSIWNAIAAAQAGDIVCIAGKGHETGQIVGNTVLPFDDRIEAADALRAREASETGG